MSNDKLVQALRDLLAKVRQDAPDLSGKLLGYCDAVLAEHDAKNQGRPAAGWIPGWSFDTNKLVAALERQGIAVPQKDRRDDGVVLWDARTARYVFVSSYRDWREAEKQSRSERLKAAGLTARDTRLTCDECGQKYTAQFAPLHKCEAEKQAGPVAVQPPAPAHEVSAGEKWEADVECVADESGPDYSVSIRGPGLRNPDYSDVWMKKRPAEQLAKWLNTSVLPRFSSPAAAHDPAPPSPLTEQDKEDAESALKWLYEEGCDLRSEARSDDDYGYVVVEHYMAKPHERVIGRGDKPLDAIRAARAKKEQP